MASFQIWGSSEAYPPLAEVRPTPLAQLLERWTELSPAGQVPMLDRLLTPALRPMLPNLALIEMAPGRVQASYALVGSTLVDLLGSDPTGKFIEDVYSKRIGDEVYEGIAKTLSLRRPTFYCRKFSVFRRSFGYYRLLLPVTIDRHDVTHLVVGIYPIEAGFTAASQWQHALQQSRQHSSMLTELGQRWQQAAQPTRQDGDGDTWLL